MHDEAVVLRSPEEEQMDQKWALAPYSRTRLEVGLPAGPPQAAASQMLEAMRRGRWDVAVRLALATGVRDANQLTDLLFGLRHPEMRGRRIEPHQRDLAREWIDIRDRYVRPALEVRPQPPSGAPPQPGGIRPSLGIDTASVAENKNPDWMRAKTQVPIDFAIIRSNWGTATDRVFRRDWPRLKDVGLVRGAYLFLRFHTSRWGAAPTPVAQARAFIATVGSLDQSDLPPSLDVEFPGGLRETRLSASQVLDGVRDAWRTLRDHYGVPPIIYTSARVWREDLNNLPAPDLVESPLWLARYFFRKGPAVYDARSVASSRLDPPVPPPWGDSMNWWIHQYQGDAIRLPGFPTGNVDMNRFNTMTRGAVGNRVRWVQRRLGVPQTGAFNPATDQALRTLQARRGLTANGVIDPRTFAYLCWWR